jgi:hypothetical protein
MIEVEQAYETLAAWCREREYAGHDPFDGLNSRLFQATPLKRTRAARLAWTQAFKRAPVNLRALARVPAGRNAKGTALFALAALSRFPHEANAGAGEGKPATCSMNCLRRAAGMERCVLGLQLRLAGTSLFRAAGDTDCCADGLRRTGVN